MRIIEQLIDSCSKSSGFFFKYISANDTGKTGGHQSGFYMPRESWPLFFDKKGEKGENRDLWLNIKWQSGQTTKSRFIWYGQGTRSEYRLTNGFNFLDDDNVGDVLVLSKRSATDFDGFILSSEEEIDSFFVEFNLSPSDSYKLQKLAKEPEKTPLDVLFHNWLATLTVDFPESIVVSQKAREFYKINSGKVDFEKIDDLIVSWLDIEFSLFKFIENSRYQNYLHKPFESVEQLVTVANTILNRRKSRAGHSLENHIAAIFDELKIPYSAQSVTEQSKKPDFLFPGGKEYADKKYPKEKLNVLAVKTTCKDRWRQVINEADRIDTKFLFTLQQGISLNQLKEMEEYNVKLVVPEKYKKDFPKEFHSKIFSLQEFVEYLRKFY